MKNRKIIRMFYFVLFITIGGCISLILGQDSNWDFLNYHFYNPYALCTGRVGYDFLAASIQSYLSPFIEVPLYLLAMYFNNFPSLVVFIQGTYFGVLCFLVFILSLDVFKSLDMSSKTRQILALFSTIIGCTGFATFSEIGTSYNDIQTSCLIIFAIFLFMKYGFSEKGYRAGISVGLVVGVACGLKLTNAIFATSFFIAITIFFWRNDYFKRISFYVIFLCIGFLASYGYWGWTLYKLYGSPFFPFYNSIFKSPFYPQTSFLDVRFFPKTFFQKICYPIFWSGFFKYPKTVAELNFFDPRFLLVYLISIHFFLNRIFSCHNPQQKERNRFSFLLLFWMMSYYVYQIKFSIYRYAMPLENLTGLVVVFVVYNFLKNKKNFAIYAMIVVTFAIIAMTRIPSWGRLKIGNKFYSVSKIDIPEDVLVTTFTAPCAIVIPGLNIKNKIVNFNFFDKNKFKTNDVAVLANIHESNTSAINFLSQYGVNFPADCKKVENNFSNNIYLCFHRKPPMEENSHKFSIEIAKERSPNLKEILTKGWHEIEATQVWSTASASLSLPVPDFCQGQACQAKLFFYVFHPDNRSDMRITFRSTDPDSNWSSELVATDDKQYQVSLPLQGGAAPRTFVIDAPTATSPKQASVGADPRILGIALQKIEIKRE